MYEYLDVNCCPRSRIVESCASCTQHGAPYTIFFVKQHLNFHAQKYFHIKFFICFSLLWRRRRRRTRRRIRVQNSYACYHLILFQTSGVCCLLLTFIQFNRYCNLRIESATHVTVIFGSELCTICRSLSSHYTRVVSNVPFKLLTFCKPQFKYLNLSMVFIMCRLL